MQPNVAFVFAAVRLEPRIAVEVAYHPAGIHLVARSYCLRMEFAARDSGEAAVRALEYLVADEACAESFWMVEFEVICFRLRMSVRQITGPVAAVVQYFAENHVGVRSDIMVENSVYTAFCYVACPDLKTITSVRGNYVK